MCGIAGFTHRTRLPDPGRIQSAIGSLAHRGPDRQAVFESRFISLGAARLKIIDLESGDQPMLDEAGDTVLVFNGEIYNHAELRGELEGLGHKFQSHSDTETVLRAFLEWDTDCFSRLRGMFAAALWTESDKRLVLARDRMGIKPLYVARRGDNLFFGSELKTIFIHPEIERRLDLAGLDCYLSLNYVPCPWTLVEGVEKLRPGYWLEWRDGAVHSESYWTLPFGSPSVVSLDEAAQELDSMLERSVREHLLSDVPIGLWLSGGIDSSTILHYAANASSAPLRTFSISFRGHSFDETAYIRQLVAQYGTRHEELDLNAGLDLRDAIEEFANFADEPNADAGALPVWFLSRMTSRTATVALSGEGADELFGGYETYRADTLARGMRRLPSAFLRLAGSMVRGWPVSDEKISFEYKLKRFLEGCRMRPEWAHVYWNGTFSDEEKRRLVHAELPGALGEILSELARAGRPHRRVSLVRSEILSAGRHSGEGRPDEHGPLRRGPSAVFGSSNRRICRRSSSGPENPRFPPENSSEAFDERPAAAYDPAAQEGRLRYTGSRMATRSATAATPGHFGDGFGARRVVPA